MTIGVLTSLGSTTIGMAVPLLTASMGEIVVEKAGVINVGIEGMMLCGAFAGFAVSQITQNAWLGLAAAVAAGIAIALVFAILALLFKANQVVVGTAVNILALGLTGVFYGALVNSPVANRPVPSFGSLPIPGLSHIPILGRMLFTQDAITYGSLLAIPVVIFFLNKTVLGLRLKSCGEYPAAADAAGVNVNYVRAAALIFGGAAAGIAGAHMSISYTVSFAQNMTAGIGFIALAVVIVGRWKPIGALIAALLFGLANALQFEIQALGLHIPYELVLALPYLATLAALTFSSKRSVAAPTMLGAAYDRS